MENLVAVDPGSALFAEGNLPPCSFESTALVCRYAPLVRRLAYQLMARLPASVNVEDVIQNGMVGLLDSASRFEEGMGAQFETYATQRIRGAMIDGLRENDWMPRALRRDMRRVESAVRALEQQHGRAPSENEVANTLEIGLGEYQRTLRDARASQIMYFEDFSEEGEADFFEKNLGDPNADPLHQLIEQRERSALVEAIAGLPERERLMMRLYYEEDLNLREIGEMLGVSESRVCQLHKQAVGRLRASMAASVSKGPVTTSSRPTTDRPCAKARPMADQLNADDLSAQHWTPNLPTVRPAVNAVNAVNDVGELSEVSGVTQISVLHRGRASNQPVFQAVIC